uniref:Putative secretory peptide-60 n=1 Tax=Pleurobrachia bachei TaxID=34499 RepID=M4H1W6_PLEBA|nr:putative secretory peptide-60 [Pleurobrachia bachei]|eukprot:sb/3460686/
MVKLTTLLLLLILVVPDVPAKYVDYSFQLVSSEDGRVSSSSGDLNEGLLVVSATNDGENKYGTLAYDEHFDFPIYRTIAIACRNMDFGTAVEFYPVSKSNFFGLDTEIKFNDIASFPYFSQCFGMESTWDSCQSRSLDQDFNKLLGLKCLPKVAPVVYNSLSILVDVPSNVVISDFYSKFSLDTPSKGDKMLYVMNIQYAPQDFCEIKGLKSLFTLQIAYRLASRDRIAGEDQAQSIASFPVLSSKNHKYKWDTSDRSRLSLQDPWTPNDLPPYLGNGLVAPIYFCQNQSLAFGPYNPNKHILNCTQTNTVIDIHSAMSGGLDKTEIVTKLCSGTSKCQIFLNDLSIEYSCTSNYSYEFSLDSDTYPVPETFGVISNWIKDKTIGYGLLKLDVNFKGTVVKSGYVKFTNSESCNFFCAMLGYKVCIKRAGISIPEMESVMDFKVQRSQGDNDGDYFILNYSEEYPTNDSAMVALLTCRPDDYFWSDNLSMVVNKTTNYLSLALDAEQNQLYTIALPSEYDDYIRLDESDYEKLSQQIKTMGNTICQEMGFREAFNVSITNTTLPDNTCIYLAERRFWHMENHVCDLMNIFQGIGVDGKYWEVDFWEMMNNTGISCKNIFVISLECSPDVLPVGEIVLSVFAADIWYINYDTYLLIGSHISDDGVKFRGPVCESPEITHTVAEGVCQRAGFKQVWQVLTLASLLDYQENSPWLILYRTSMYYQMGSGLMEVHDLAAGNFTKNTCDLEQIVVLSCIGTYAPYRLKDFFKQDVNEYYYRIPEYKVQGRTALICSDSDVGFLDGYCAESIISYYDLYHYKSNNSFSHRELIEMLNLANSNNSNVQEKLQIMENLESGLYVECGTEGECEWQIKNCSTFLAVSCVKANKDDDGPILVTDSSTFFETFANLDNLVEDLTSNFGTVAGSVREYSRFTGVKSVSLPYLIICDPMWEMESSVTEACRSGGFLDYANLTYVLGCSSCWPDRLNDGKVVLFYDKLNLETWTKLNSISEFTIWDDYYEYSYQTRVTCQGSRLALLNSDDKVSQGYPVMLEYDSSGSVDAASPVLITNFDQANGLCRTFRGNGAFWFSEPETFNSSLLDGAGILSSSVLNGELHCGRCFYNPEHFGDCSFSTVSSSDEPKGVYLECLESEDEELNEDLASTFLNFSKGFFSVGGFNWASNEFELCAEHGMTLDGVKWLLSWFDVDLTTINSFILHPSANITNSFAVFCQETQREDTHCAFKSISECNGWTIEVVFNQHLENIELVDDILYVPDQVPVCADNFTDHLAANFCWIFGYNKGGYLSTPLVNDSSATINCSTDSCQFATSTCSSGALPKGVYLECLEPEDEELCKDLASTFLNFSKGFFSVGGFNWAGNEFALCAEHGMTLDGVKWLLSWFDVDLTTINSFILHPSANTTNSFAVFCQETQRGDTHCAFKSISECNGWTIEVVFNQHLENIELVDDILYVPDQVPVCADNFTDHLAANFCWIFGYNKGGFSSTPLVNDSSATINCSTASCQFVTRTCSSGALVRLNCQDIKNIISYTFIEGYDESPRGASGLLGVLWNDSDQPRVLYINPPRVTNSTAVYLCEALGYSPLGGTLRESPDDITHKDDILVLKLDCPISFSDRYFPSIETVTGDEANWYSPVILACEYQTSDIRFTWEKANSSVGKANMILRAQYHIIYLNGSVLEVSGAVELSDKTDKDLLCRTAGASKYNDYYITQGTAVVASDFQCLSDPVENMTKDCTYQVNYNFAGFDPLSMEI